MALTSNRAVLAWIDEMAAMTQPDQLVWIDGSEAQLEELRKQACASGEIERLNEEKLPAATSTHSGKRRGPGGGPHLHLLQKAGGRRPHQHWMDPRRCTPS